jgi:carbonic anhydrase/acetyltransferase-like protein (isoleucine patch superfamily)
MVNQLIGFGAGGASPPAFSLVNAAGAYPALGAVSTHTLNTIAVSTANEFRHVIFAVMGFAQSNESSVVSGVTVNGAAMTAIGTPSTVGAGSGITILTALFVAALATGTTADFVVTTSTNQNIAYNVWAMYGGNATPTATAADSDTTLSQSLTIPAGGGAVGCAIGNRVSIGTASWTNMDTEDLDVTTINANNAVSAAHHATAGTAAREVSWSGGALSFAGMSVAAFAPL